MINRVNGVSLFANVGIAETYIKNHNIDIVVANELLEKRASFYRENHRDSNMICGDIAHKEIFNEVLSEAKELKYMLDRLNLLRLPQSPRQ